jgi:hypothetical protein
VTDPSPASEPPTLADTARQSLDGLTGALRALLELTAAAPGRHAWFIRPASEDSLGCWLVDPEGERILRRFGQREVDAAEAQRLLGVTDGEFVLLALRLVSNAP